MNCNYEIGVLLLANNDDTQMGVVVLDPGGMLVFRVIKTGLHYFAMKPIARYFEVDYTGEDLWKKYANILDQEGRIPDDILLQEARSLAEAMNSHGVSFAGMSVYSRAYKRKVNGKESDKLVSDSSPGGLL